MPLGSGSGQYFKIYQNKNKIIFEDFFQLCRDCQENTEVISTQNECANQRSCGDRNTQFRCTKSSEKSADMSQSSVQSASELGEMSFWERTHRSLLKTFNYPEWNGCLYLVLTFNDSMHSNDIPKLYLCTRHLYAFCIYVSFSLTSVILLYLNYVKCKLLYRVRCYFVICNFLTYNKFLFWSIFYFCTNYYILHTLSVTIE